MNQFFYCSVLLLSVAPIVCMDKAACKDAYRELPQLIIANSSTNTTVSGWMQLQPPSNTRKTFTLLPDAVEQMEFSRKYSWRFLATIQVANKRYHLNMRNFHVALYLESEPFKVNDTYKITSFIVQKIHLDHITQFISLRIRPEGTATLFVPGLQVHDGRPHVEPSVYKEITGHAAYTTPEFLLGLPEHFIEKDIDNAYASFMLNKRLTFINSEFKDDIFKLIVWAKNTLKERVKQKAPSADA